MQADAVVISLSLVLLTATLGTLAARGISRFLRDRSRPQLMWGVGLSLAAAGTGVELVVYVGVVNDPLLQTYVFLSAAIVGILSLGSTRAIRSPRFRTGYTFYALAMCTVVGALTYSTPLSSSMVTGGVISGNPPLDLLVVSSLVTVPATLVLLGAVAISLRRSWQWRTLMMGIGACVLAAGGALYIASFPAALYYSEFIGVILIFIGLVSLPHVVLSPSRATDPLGKST